MSDTLVLLNAILPVLGLIGVGGGIRRMKWLTPEADASLVRMVVNLLTPCLIADTILGNPVFGRVGNVVLPPLLGFGTTVLGIGLGWWAGRRLEEKERRTFALTAGICNYGYIPLPLAQVLFSAGTVGVLFVQNIGVELAMWLVGLSVLSGRSWRGGWRHLLNPPVFAIIGTLALNAVLSREAVPAPILQAVHLLGRCAIPLGLMLIGATLADLLPGMGESVRWRVVLLACGVRLIGVPVMMLGLAWWIPASREVREVLLLHAAMPAAVFPIIMARHYGGDAGTALRVVVGTSLASAVTIPFWLKAGMVLLGL
ncbi:MAG: AEC family transporter [Verrucomicrobiae bacterium]|nr:AEC family transporter [Verrucomicrobiae bacterium]